MVIPMKRTILALFTVFFIFQGTASAKVEKYIQGMFENTHVFSVFTTKIDKDSAAGKEYYLRIELRRNRIKLPTSYIVTEEIRFTAYNPENHFKPAVLFDTKNPPKLEITSAGSAELFLLDKEGTAWKESYNYSIRNDRMHKFIKNADKIIIVVPMQDKTEKRIELPREVLAEWKYILSTVMATEKRMIKQELKEAKNKIEN